MPVRCILPFLVHHHEAEGNSGLDGLPNDKLVGLTKQKACACHQDHMSRALQPTGRVSNIIPCGSNPRGPASTL